ncbi:MAG TPA: enolase C-terminal domain-like protein [Myxococcota bacterium]|nr:enolase C-terminal domain-like protein [Myxococcota bacterium]
MLSLCQGEEVIGVGEYAPMSGIHPHAIEDALHQVQSFPVSMLSSDLFESMPQPLGYILSLAHFHASEKKAPKKECPTSIKLAALVEANNVNQAVQLAQGYLAQGFTCLKIKVGSLSVEEERQKIKTIAAIGDGNLSLRLDANKRLTLVQAIDLVKNLKQIKIEYFEEPLRDIGEAKELHEATGVDIALDESFNSMVDLDRPHLQYLIMKPSRFNSIYQAMNLAQEAMRLGKSVILSHCFESEHSSALYALFIHRLALHERAHGILAEGFFKHGVFASPLRSFRGTLPLTACYNAIVRAERAGRGLQRIS